LYKQVIYGYSTKLDLKQVNGIDDFNTIRRINTPLANAIKPLDISTKVRANGSEIEYLRRIIGLTEDSNMDASNFVIVLVRDGGDYVSKKAEGYSSITGVYDFATGYNYDISPARMLQNWMAYLSTQVIYSKSKTMVGVSGEGNYAASTTKTGETALFENGDVDLSLENPLFDQFVYQLAEVPLTRSQVDLIKATPFGYLAFKDKDGVTRVGFVDDNGIEHDSNKGQASISLLKAYQA